MCGSCCLSHPPSPAVPRTYAQDWRRFQSEGAKQWRPQGRSAYSEQDLAAARARGMVSEVRNSIPSPYQLVRDGRFWLTLLVLAAVVPAIYGAMQSGPSASDIIV